MGRERQDSFASKAKAAIRDAQINVPPDKVKKVADWLKDVYSKSQDKALKSRQSKETPRALANLVILRHFGFIHADVRKLLLSTSLASDEVKSIVTARREEVSWLARVYGTAASGFEILEEKLLAGNSLQEVDLRAALSPPASSNRKSPMPQSLPLVSLIEELRETDAFQDGSPDAVCKLVERYIDAGALRVAENLLSLALSQSPEHPGLWFQKSRLFLSQSKAEAHTAFRHEMMAEESEVLSSAEWHYQEMANEHNGKAADARLRVFDVCLKALSLLPDKQDYDVEIHNWSTDLGAARVLRRQILASVVNEAGLRADPYRLDGDSRDRVLARLGRVTKWAPGTETGYVVDELECARLSQEPLFSELTDGVILGAYDELMQDYFSLIERTHIRLGALNFLRFLAPDKYPREITKFVEDLRNLPPEEACHFAGPFEAIPVFESDRTWRAVMFEHLDFALGLDAQSALVNELHGKWVAWIEQQKRETTASLYIDRIRRCFDERDWAGAYRLVCKGETGEILDREDALHAFVIWQSALAAAKDADDNGKAEQVASIVARHLSDQMMAERAQQYRDTRFVDEDYCQMPTPLDGEELDEFCI